MVRPRAPRRLRKPASRDDLGAIVDECIVLSDRLVWLAEHIHGEEGRGAVRRGVLRGLARFGPQTVPEMAKARSVTRQNVQPVIDALERDGLVERRPNPAHLRSPRFEVTDAGRALVARMDRNDARVLGAVGRGLSPADVATTARTLRTVRERFEVRWKSALGLVALVLALALAPSAPARADVVGVWDPTLAQLCGGSAHSPRCRAEHVGLACCGGVVGLGALVGLALAARGGRRKE